MAITPRSFDERLARIASERAASSGLMTVHVGEQALRVRGLDSLSAPETSSSSRLAKKLRTPALLMACFALGIASMAVVLLAYLRLRGVPSADEWAAQGHASYALGAMVALMLSTTLATALKINTSMLKSTQFAGVIFALLSLHNLAFWTPGLSALLFTPDWVSLQHQVATPMSLIYRGFVVPLAL